MRIKRVTCGFAARRAISLGDDGILTYKANFHSADIDLYSSICKTTCDELNFPASGALIYLCVFPGAANKNDAAEEALCDIIAGIT
jgi:hypothetical protein